MDNSAQLKKLTSWMAFGPQSEAGWVSIENRPLLILVGLTGVGKSTVTAALAEQGLRFSPLPNRRLLTDRLIIEAQQRFENLPVQPVTDREKRFAFTRRYRARFAGGMAHALAQLWVLPSAGPAPNLLFDGLRGANEVSYASEHLPRAHFLLLEASTFVRLQRLLGRNDRFDQVSTSEKKGSAAFLENKAEFLSRSERQKLAGWVEAGEFTQAEILGKVKIVAAERQNYDPDATRRTLLSQAPERILRVDTERLSPQEIAAKVRNFLDSVR